MCSQHISNTSTSAVPFQSQGCYNAAGTDNQAFCYDEQNQLVWAGSSTGTLSCGSWLTAGSVSSDNFTQTLKTAVRHPTTPFAIYHAQLTLERLFSTMAVGRGQNSMIENRSAPAAIVIPVLSYENIGEASRWLCQVFGFRERLIIGDHRIQLHAGDGGAVILTQRPTSQGPHSCHSVLVRVTDADSHYEDAKQHGAHVTQPPESYPFGERQYSVEDPGGHLWTFSQSIADVAPEDWGGTSVDLG